MVLVDTSVWSLALRRRPADLNPQQRELRAELASLIQHGAVALIGPIRQELLSGIRSEQQYETLREYLRSFPEEPIAIEDYEAAARLTNVLLSRGVTASSMDALIAAMAVNRGWHLFTADAAFARWSRLTALHLHALP